MHHNNRLSFGEHTVCAVSIYKAALGDFMVHACMHIARKIIINVWETAFIMLEHRGVFALFLKSDKLDLTLHRPVVSHFISGRIVRK